jgi:hypothetical protein
MSIPIIIRVKGLYNMPAKQRASQVEHVESEYRRASDKGMPLVVGPNCEVVWPVEEWEHRMVEYDSHVLLWDVIQHNEKNGWAMCSHGDGIVVFKRPAREGNNGSTP